MRIYKLSSNISFEDVEAQENELNIKYPLAGSMVDGLSVLDYVSNTDSIDASLYKYYILDGIREVNMYENGESLGSDRSYSVARNNIIDELMNEIRNSGEIEPLIFVTDLNGDNQYILEGSHRIDALHRLGIKKFPALVVINLD